MQPDFKERLIGGLLLATLIYVWIFGVIVVPLATYQLLAKVSLSVRMAWRRDERLLQWREAMHPLS